MGKRVVYLDNAATTPMGPEVASAMEPYLRGAFHNPSSLYAPAQEARAAIEAAREALASSIGARPGEIRFTSGGTEADNAAVKGIALANAQRGRHVIVSAIEHHAVLESAAWLERMGFAVERLPVDGEGLVSPRVLARTLRPDTVLVSVMMANNEVGTVEPVRELAACAHEAGALFHTDAVQAYGHLPIDVAALGVDALSASAHKLGGPKGVGFLYCRRGVRCEPLIHGGAQERGYRAGTENVAGIVGFAAAVELAQSVGSEDEVARLRDHACARILAEVPGARINGSRDARLAGNVSVSVPGVSGEALLMLLDDRGVCVSAGAACASGSLEQSHVLAAMGVDPSWATVRISLSRATSRADVDYAVDCLVEAAAHLRSVS